MIISKKLLPRSNNAHGETIAVVLHVGDEDINATIKISDVLLSKYPAVSEGNIPESVMDDLFKNILTDDSLEDGCIISISSPITDDPDVNCMVSIKNK